MLRLTGEAVLQLSSGASADLPSHTCSFSAASDSFNYALYSFSGLTEQDAPFNIGLELSAPLPADCWLACSDYSRGAWQWQELAAPAASQTLSISPGAQARSAAGNVYVVVAAVKGTALTVGAVSLELDAQVPAPATPDTTTDLADRVSLSWPPLDQQQPGLNFDSIIVERASAAGGPYSKLVEIPASASSFDDVQEGSGPGQNNLTAYTNYYYHLRFKRLGATGPVGFARAGRRSIGDVTSLSATSSKIDRITLSWTAVQGALQYEIEYRALSGSPANFTPLATVSSATYDHMWDSPAGKACDTLGDFEYRVRATAIDIASQNWSPSTTGKRLITTIPISASDGTRPDGIDLTWTGISGATGYRIYRDGTSESEFIAEVPDSAGYLDAPPDLNKHSYSLRVVFHSEVGAFGPLDEGQRQGWTTHLAGINSSIPLSMVSVGGYPLILSFHDNELVFHYATVQNPLSSADWNVDSIVGDYLMDFPVMSIVNGKPFFFCGFYSLDTGSTNFFFIHANTTAPGGIGDWIFTYLNSQPGQWQGNCVPTVIGQRIVLALQDYINQRMDIWYSTVDDPQLATDFASYTLDPNLPISATLPAIVDIGGQPTLIYGKGTTVRQARSTVAVPASVDDWNLTDVLEAGQAFGSSSLSGFGLVNSSGKPVFACADYQNRQAYLVRGLVAEPAQSSDWSVSQIGALPAGANPGEIGLITYGLGLKAVWCDFPGFQDAAAPIYSYTTGSSTPAGSGDWQQNAVDLGAGYATLMLNNGLPALCYSHQFDQVTHEVCFATQ